MKRILILGGGIYQVPLIERALKTGYWVAVASQHHDDPGMRLANESWEVNLTDRETILTLVREKKIEAVTSIGTELTISAIGYIHDLSGLPGISLVTARLSTNKFLARKRFIEKRVPTARFKQVKTLDDVLSAAKEIGLPVYVKAPDSSESRGITIVTEPGEIDSAFREAMNISRKKSVLIEEKLSGVEFGAQVIVIDGKITHCLCHNNMVSPPPEALSVGHSLPFLLAEEVRYEACKVCTAAVDALKIENAVCTADLILTPDGVRILELGARIGDAGRAEIVELHHGINLYDVALSFAFGEHPEIPSSPGPAAAYRIIRAPCSGKLVSLFIPPEVLELEGVVEVSFDYPEGVDVSKSNTAADRIGHVLVTAGDAAAAEELAERVIEKLDIEVMAVRT